METPQVFVRGHYVGGCDALISKVKTGELGSLFEHNWPPDAERIFLSSLCNGTTLENQYSFMIERMQFHTLSRISEEDANASFMSFATDPDLSRGGASVSGSFLSPHRNKSFQGPPSPGLRVQGPPSPGPRVQGPPSPSPRA
mmetsp:Transcript_18231/g.28289  ORF Transcript_18231/g.28289 Transcript_18231/m.28289 type:complete len:142 (+) Transcript_18231:235-660(+)